MSTGKFKGKSAHRQGKLQLIDASGMWQKMRKSLGSKRKELSPEHIAEITRLFGECKEVSIDPETRKPIKIKFGSPRPASGRTVSYGAGGEGHTSDTHQPHFQER